MPIGSIPTHSKPLHSMLRSESNSCGANFNCPLFRAFFAGAYGAMSRTISAAMSA
jgi:hypothetical protein